MKKFIVSVVLTLVLSATGWAVAEEKRVLTLEWAKATALLNNPDLGAAKERTLQALELVNQARAAYLPSISHTTSWQYTEATGEGSPAFDENQYANRLSVTQVLFNGFLTRYATLSARAGVKMSREGEQDARRLLIWNVSQGFLNIQLARENMAIARSDMEYNTALAREAGAKLKAGTGSLSDHMNFEIRVNSARASLIEAKQSYREALFALYALMGETIPGDVDAIEIEGLNPDRGAVPLDPDSRIMAALENRPDLKQDRLALEQADAEVEKAKSGFYPELTLTGAYGSDGSWEEVGDRDELGASLGLKLNFNLFAGGATRSKVSQARSGKREKEKDLEKARIDAISDVRASFTSVVSAGEQLTLQETNVELVTRTRDLVEKEYRAGQVSLVRLNEAQNTLVASRGELAKARVSLALALEQLDYYTGKNIGKWEEYGKSQGIDR
ncbi:MAG: TolC family protein [Desulfobacteraceae bacterium]|nr:TolC family protein [Desulfobacteraceae bacterium]